MNYLYTALGVVLVFEAVHLLFAVIIRDDFPHNGSFKSAYITSGVGLLIIVLFIASVVGGVELIKLGLI